MRKIIQLILYMLLLSAPIYSYADTVETCFTFDKESKTITDYDKNCGPIVVIPSTISGVTVENIGESAFQSKGLTSIEIPNTVINIGALAFSYNKLTSLIIPDSVTDIGNYLLEGNEVLTNLKLGNSVKTIGECAFELNQLTNIEIPDSVTYIGDNAFSNNKLTNLTIGTGITSIGDRVFYGNRLTNVIIPDSVIKIGNNAFQRNQLTSIELGNGLKNIGSDAFNGNKLTDIIIPDSVTSIGGGAFSENQLTNVTIGTGITSIGDRVFYANRLTNITIPESVTSIGKYAFANNYLTGIYIPQRLTSVQDKAFVNNLGVVKLMCNGYTTNPMISDIANAELDESCGAGSGGEGTGSGESNTGTTDDSCFTFDTGTRTITSYDKTCGSYVVIPGTISGVTVENIGDSAFYYKQLTSVEIPNSVTTIGDYAFYKNQLTSVEIPNSVTSIGNRSFKENKLKSIKIPNSVITIGNYAFEYNQLTNITIGTGVTRLRGVFKDNQLTHVEIPNSVTTIIYAFENNNLTSVTIPDSVTDIGRRAFVNNKLTDVTIGNSVTSIGRNAFENNNLTNVYIPSSLNSIGIEAFKNNSGTVKLKCNGYTANPEIDERANAILDESCKKIEKTVTRGGSSSVYPEKELDNSGSLTNSGKIENQVKTEKEKEEEYNQSFCKQFPGQFITIVKEVSTGSIPVVVDCTGTETKETITGNENLENGNNSGNSSVYESDNNLNSTSNTDEKIDEIEIEIELNSPEEIEDETKNIDIWNDEIGLNCDNVTKWHYDDISEDYAKCYIQKLTENGTIYGFGDNTYKSEQNISRGEYLALIMRGLNIDLQTSRENKFTDIIGESVWMNKYVNKALEMGLISSEEENNYEFRPNDSISRIEAISILMKLMGIELDNSGENNFADIDMEEWMDKYIIKLNDMGLIKGTKDEDGNPVIKPNEKITRAEVAKMTYLIREY